MSIVKINASDQLRSSALRKTIQEHTNLSVPKIIAGKTAKGTYFYKEMHPSPFKYIYTALLKPDGTEIIAQKMNNWYLMTKSKNGVIVSDYCASKFSVGDKTEYKFASNTMCGQKKTLPDKVIEAFKALDKKTGELSPIKTFLSCISRKLRQNSAYKLFL